MATASSSKATYGPIGLGTQQITTRDRMIQAKARLIAAEKEEAYERAKRETRSPSYAASLDSEPADTEVTETSGLSRTSSIPSTPISILRQTTPLSTPERSRPLAYVAPSPAPDLPLPPAPTPVPMSRFNSIDGQSADFGPALPSPTGVGSISSSSKIRRRSSRVRFSDQQLQPPSSFNGTLLAPVSRASSLKGLRRQSSIEGLRADLAQASSSLNRRISTASNSSLGRRISTTSIGSSCKRASFASSTESDPFNWATSSCGSRPSMSFPLSDGIELEVDEEGFKPQMLPYPKVPPALSRLSVDTAASSTWSDSCSSIISSIPSPTLKETLETASLGSSVNDLGFSGSRKDSAFSLEAKIRLPIEGSEGAGRSSYAPSTSLSLRSSISDQELDSVSAGNASNSSSFSFHLPPRAQTIAYATLLPRRRSSLRTNGRVPHINRGEWDDPELGLSPRSGPLAMESLSGRGKTKLVEITASPEVPDAEDEDEEGAGKRASIDIELCENTKPLQENLELNGTRIDSLGLLSPCPSPSLSAVQTELKEEIEGEEDRKKKGHFRSESTLSAIMSFPIPPDRKVELEHESAPTPALGMGPLSMEATLDVLFAEIQEEAVLDLDDESTPMPAQTDVMLSPGLNGDTPIAEKMTHFSPLQIPTQPLAPTSHDVDARVISLNSPFEFDQTGTLAEPINIVSPIFVSETASPVCQELTPPSSPELREMISRIARPRKMRSVSAGLCPSASMMADTETETEESDIDVASPLVKVAARSRILTPRSRLLRPSAQPPTSPSPSLKLARPRPGLGSRSVSVNSVSSLSSLRSGVGLTSGRGWSGSESEEEEWVKAVRQVAARKAGMTPDAKVKQNNKADLRSQEWEQSEGRKTPPTSLTIQVGLKVDEAVDDTPTAKMFLTSSTFVHALDAATGAGTGREGKDQNRLSQLSEMSMLSASTIELDQGPLTPLSLGALTPASAALSRSVSSSSTASLASSGKPGPFPWGASSPPNSPVRGLFASNISNGGVSPTKEVFITSFRNLTRARGPGSQVQSRNSSSASSNKTTRLMSKGRDLPTPTRAVEGWGEPEILIDESGPEWGSGTESDTDFESRAGWGVGTLSLRSLSSLSLRSETMSLGMGGSMLDLGQTLGAGSYLESATGTDDGESDLDTPRKVVVGRVPSPDIWAGMEADTSLMDEEIPV